MTTKRSTAQCSVAETSNCAAQILLFLESELPTLPYMRLFSLVFFLACSVAAFGQSRVDSLSSELKREIARRDIYVSQRVSRIEDLKKKLPFAVRSGVVAEFMLYNDLYHEYKTFIYDSAFRYAQKLISTAYRLGDKTKIGYARVKLGFILISSGMFKETFDSLNVVELKYLDDSTRVDYYRLLARAYSDLIVYNKDDYYRKLYKRLDHLYMDSALKWVEPHSYYYYYLNAVQKLHDGDNRGSVAMVDSLFSRHKLSWPQQAVNYFDLSEAYLREGDSEKAVEYAIRASLADIKAATKETAAMHTLAKMMYDRGDTENAAIFIRQAVDDAGYYGARQRKVEIGAILPAISAAELSASETQRKLWIGYGIGLSVFLFFTATLAFIIYKQVKKLKAAELKISQANEVLTETNNKLIEANKIKEEYIGYYFSVNSEYVDRIEALKRSVEQKLNARKFDDLRFLINNMNSKRDREELYGSFDKVFLKLFPDFVTSLNSYLKEGEQFVMKDGELLNTELRIFALIRMGITDNEDIARILNYSVNTIYAYKTRVRNKSVLPNDVFDRKIMEIKSV